MISNITNYQNININNLYGIKNYNNNTNIYNINNIANSSYRSNAYTLYDKNNALFIGNYTSTLSNLKELNSKLIGDNEKSVLNSIAVSSSNENILSAKSFFTPQEKTSYKVNVSQIAKSQVNTSNSLNSDDISDMGISIINILNKSKNYSFTIDTSGKTNKEFLLDIAAKINKSNIGISAIVKEKDNKSILELVGDKTGENEGFLVTGSDEFMLQTNLSNITQIAQDAIFDVTKNGNFLAKNKKSSSNEVDIDGYKVSATLKDVGQVTINLNIDKKKVSDAVNNFVSAYNTTLNFLSENINKGSSISKHLDNLKIPEIYEKNLNSIGINKNADGKLSVDNKVLNDALSNNIEDVEKVLGSRYSAFSKIDKSINSALKASSISLVDGTLYGQASSNSSINYDLLNQINLLSIYNNNGRFGMINFSAIGLILNMFA